LEGTKLTTAEIKSAITDALTDSASLAAVKKWLQAEPSPTRYPAAVFGWVEWEGGPANPESSTKKIVDNFFVVIVRKSVDSETNENEIIGLADEAVAALEAEKTFGGKCFDSWVSNREKQKVFQGDYDLVAVRLTLHTDRLEG
jgi:hypothetical protein